MTDTLQQHDGSDAGDAMSHPEYAADDRTGAGAAPKVFGILSIIFGSLTFVCTNASGAFSVLADPSKNLDSPIYARADRAKLRQAFESHRQRTVPVQVGQMAGFGVMSLALLFIGIGQLRMRRWARKASVAWGAAGLLAVVAMLAVNALVVGPSTQAFVADLRAAFEGKTLMSEAMGMSASWTSTWWASAAMAVLYGAYPLLLLIYFCRDSAARVMDR